MWWRYYKFQINEALNTAEHMKVYMEASGRPSRNFEFVLDGIKNIERLRDYWGEQVAETYTSRSGGCCWATYPTPAATAIKSL